MAKKSYGPPAPNQEESNDEILLSNKPVPDEHLDSTGNEKYKQIFSKLQGNILKGHGRDVSANIFVRFTCSKGDIVSWLSDQAKTITSAAKQLQESNYFKRFGIPGALFKNIYLTSNFYELINISDYKHAFDDPKEGTQPFFPQNANFLGGMLAAAEDFADDLKVIQDRITSGEAEPLEIAYLQGDIHALILLADDGETYLQRSVREFITEFEEGTNRFPPLGQVLAVELGKALRNQEGEGIEHFGYVDGRSQPLFLESDFKPLKFLESGQIDLIQSKEKINEKAIRKESGDMNVWNPFAKLEQVLIKDKLAKHPFAYGSYFVFRKLEQDVMRFSMEEQNLADALNLIGQDRERAGAMAVGRFRDGTPLTLSETDGLIPAKANNFRYDGLDASLETGGQVDDKIGLKCPFHAHIRKTNPRQADPPLGGSVDDQDTGDRNRRIVRRGIPFGDRIKAPNAFQALDDLPSRGVGLLFGCFQSSITKQFAFMQKAWVNGDDFRSPKVGIDPLIGQHAGKTIDQSWRKSFGVDTSSAEPDQPFPNSHPVKFSFKDFIKFRGGEFFFAPSIEFFNSLPRLTGITI